VTEETHETFWRRNNPIMWGVLATVSVFVCGMLAAFQPVCQTNFWGSQACGENKWVYFLKAAPNEVGDTLAGFAGGLAFVWLIATVWLQGQELAAQRVELKEQRKATQDMARAQHEQVKLLQVQGAIFKDEQRQRDEQRAEMLFNETLRSLISELRETGSHGLHWAFSNNVIDDEFGSDGEIHGVSLQDYIEENATIDEAILKFRERLLHMHDVLWDYVHQSVDYRLPLKTDCLLQIMEKIERVVEMRCDLSPSQQERLSRMRLSEISTTLEKLQLTPEFWTEHET